MPSLGSLGWVLDTFPDGWSAGRWIIKNIVSSAGLISELGNKDYCVYTESILVYKSCKWVLYDCFKSQIKLLLNIWWHLMRYKYNDPSFSVADPQRVLLWLISVPNISDCQLFHPKAKCISCVRFNAAQFVYSDIRSTTLLVQPIRNEYLHILYKFDKCA